MEHASNAAFARFALELLSLGAPASLVAATHAAIADATAHARDAFALASAYAGVPVGPGPLAEAVSSLSSRTPADIVRTAILEGCVGETVAATEASVALEQATDEAVRAALGKIVLDETAHATLAWRFVQWIIEGNVADLRDVAVQELLAVANGMPRFTAAPLDGDRTLLAAHGVLGEAERLRIQAEVVAAVVMSCAEVLVSSVAPTVERTELAVANLA